MGARDTGAGTRRWPRGASLAPPQGRAQPGGVECRFLAVGTRGLTGVAAEPTPDGARNPVTTTTATTTRPRITKTTITGPPTSISPPRASRAGGPLAPSRETVPVPWGATRTAAATPNPAPDTTNTAPSGPKAREGDTAVIPTIPTPTGRTAAMGAMTTTPAGTTCRREPKTTGASVAAAASAAIAVSADAGSAGATRATTSGPTTACPTRTTGPR